MVACLSVFAFGFVARRPLELATLRGEFAAQVKQISMHDSKIGAIRIAIDALDFPTTFYLKGFAPPKPNIQSYPQFNRVTLDAPELHRDDSVLFRLRVSL